MTLKFWMSLIVAGFCWFVLRMISEDLWPGGWHPWTAVISVLCFLACFFEKPSYSLNGW